MFTKIDEKAIISRIRKLRQKYAGERGKALFAKALGISPSTYNYYEQDRLPPVGLLWGICEITGTDIRWLLTGQSPLGPKNLENALPRSLVDKINLLISRDSSNLAALEAFVSLLGDKSQLENKLKRAVVPSLPQDDSNVTLDNQSPSEDAKSPSWLPILGRTAAGIVHFWSELGSRPPSVTELADLFHHHKNTRHLQIAPQEVSKDPAVPNIPALDVSQVTLVQLIEPQADDVSEFIDCAEITRIYPDAFALRVDGDSMAPWIIDSDIVVLSPSVSASNGAVAVVQLSDQIGVTCKIIRRQANRVHLIPANEKFEVKIYDQNQLVWALAVLWRIRLK